MPIKTQGKQCMKQQLDDDLYMRFRSLLLSRAGLYYPEHRRDDLAHGLSQVLTAYPYETLEALYEDAAAGKQGWDAVLAHLTVGETRFFRNEAHFDALRRHIFPEMIERRANLRMLRIWSAGCASGEEPYSIAMLLTELLPNPSDWSVTILATDINPLFLQRAREGAYSAWSFRETPEDLRSRFFSPEQGRWRLNDNIRRMVTFTRLNLAEPSYPSITNGTYALDMIICRNVTIYFDQETTRQIAERFYAALAPGGWLLVGHSEPQAQTYRQFETHNFPNAIFYRKSLDAPLFVTDFQGNLFSASSAANTPTVARSAVERRDPSSKKARESTPAASARTGTARSSAPKPATSKPTTAPLHTTAPESTTAPLKSARQPAAPPPKQDAWQQIQAYLAQGDKPRAEAALHDLLQSEPGHIQALIAQGRLRADKGDWEGARQYCEQALLRDTMAAEAAYLLAQVYEHEGQLDEALAAYRRTVYIDRNFVLGTVGMASVWRQLGRVNEAQRAYRNLLKQLATFPTNASVPGAEGATVGELVQFVQRQLESLL
jgi:chemotaxis protein methyltransferase CheR